MNKLTIPSILLGTTIYITVSFISVVSAEGNHEGGHGDDSSHGNAHWASPKKAAARINPIKSDKASIERGKQLYMTNCTTCHGVTAEGDGPVGANLNPKPTNLTIMAGNHSDGDFEWKIANGRGAMPGWKSSMNQKQRWDLVNFIQALENPNGKGNMATMDHSNMSDEEIKAMMGEAKPAHSDDDDHHKAKKDSHSH